VPSELVRVEHFDETLKLQGLNRTDSMHLNGMSTSGDGNFNVESEDYQVAGNDMNKVSMEREMSRLAANTLKYEAVGKVISQQIGILKYAASDGRG
jgi:flagellar basal-body rod protein FlgB